MGDRLEATVVAGEAIGVPGCWTADSKGLGESGAVGGGAVVAVFEGVERAAGDANSSFCGAGGSASTRLRSCSAINPQSRRFSAKRATARWASEAWQGYIWEDCTLTLGLAGKMLAAPWAVHGGLI